MPHAAAAPCDASARGCGGWPGSRCRSGAARETIPRRDEGRGWRDRVGAARGVRVEVAGAWQGRAAARAATRAVPAHRHRSAAADRAHRRADDGEPLLRQLPRHAAGPRRGLPARAGRRARGVQPGHRRRVRPRAPPDLHGPAPEGAVAELACEPPAVAARDLRGVRGQHPDGAARRRPRRRHGVLDRRRHPLLLRPGPDLPAGRPLVQLLPGPHVPQPPLPHRGNGARPHRRPAVRPARLPARRDHLRHADQARNLLGQLPRGARGQAHGPALCPSHAPHGPAPAAPDGAGRCGP